MLHLLKSSAGVPGVEQYSLYTQAQKKICLLYVVHISIGGELSSITKPQSLSPRDGPFTNTHITVWSYQTYSSPQKYMI